MKSPANIRGKAPFLCDTDGRPTGIHLQLSQNWHSQPTVRYAMMFAMLPPRAAKYRLRLAYGFYGRISTASLETCHNTDIIS